MRSIDMTISVNIKSNTVLKPVSKMDFIYDHSAYNA